MSKAYQQSGSSYIPRSDKGFRDWMLNFAGMIHEDAYRFGLTPADGDVLIRLAQDYDHEYALCQSSATRTSGRIAHKDAVRASAEQTARTYAMQVKANKGVDNATKIELGLHVRKGSLTPVRAPTTAPLLDIICAFSGSHQLRFSDESTPTARRKPPSVTQLQLYVHVGPRPVTNWQLATFMGVYTRNPIHYSFTPDQAGLVATYFGRWCTTRGLTGPFSLGVSMLIAFGGPADAGLPLGGISDADDAEGRRAA